MSYLVRTQRDAVSVLDMYDVLPALTIKRNFLWDATPYSLAEFYLCFGRTYCLYLDFFYFHGVG
jgi:hypothetical protein